MAVALGSNVGDRMAHLREGVLGLARMVSIERVSPVYASDPVGLEDQPEFLNAVVVGRTPLSPDDLLNELQATETRAGRRRTVAWGPRTLDLDLVFYGNRVIHTDRLEVPHPRWLDRSFVLVPLAEIAPELIDPVSGRAVGDLSAQRTVVGLRPYAPPSALETVL